MLKPRGAVFLTIILKKNLDITASEIGRFF